MKSTISRRFFCAGLAASSLTPTTAKASDRAINITSLNVTPDSARDQSAAFNLAFEEAVRKGQPLFVPAGNYQAAQLVIPSNLSLFGVRGATHIRMTGPGVMALGASNVSLADLTFESLSHEATAEEGFIHLVDAANARLSHLAITGRLQNAICLRQSSGIIEDCDISGARYSAIYANNSRDLKIRDNRIADCGDNGILVWRDEKSSDGTVISGNTIRHIRAMSGGNGQNGNGINLFRASDCMVFGNRIDDCAFTAIRANNADNAQITTNRVRGLGEVAIFVEFGSTGAVIAQNIIEDAAAGISITNADHEGRLAVVQGNIIRRLKERSTVNPDLTRPYGIGAEFDTTINANVIEGAKKGTGIVLGWGPYCRNLVATGNVLRQTRRGIEISVARGAERAVIRSNSFSAMGEAAILGMAWGQTATTDLIKIGHSLHHIEGNVLT